MVENTPIRYELTGLDLASSWSDFYTVYVRTMEGEHSNVDNLFLNRSKVDGVSIVGSFGDSLYPCVSA